MQISVLFTDQCLVSFKHLIEHPEQKLQIPGRGIERMLRTV